MKKNTFFFLVFFLLLIPSLLFAFPDEEHPLDGTKPLNFGFTAQATQIAVTSDNRYLVVAYNKTVQIIDLASFSLLSTQINPFDSTVGGIAIQPNTYNLYIVTVNGFMHTTQVDDPAATPTKFDISDDIGSSAVPSLMVAGKELTDNNIYFLDTGQNNVFVFDTGTNTIEATIPLETNNNSYTPTDIDIASFPSRFNSAETTDRIFVSTDQGVLWYIDIDDFNAVPVDILSLGTNISGISVDPTNDVIYLVDNTNTEIDVVSTSDPTTTTMVTITLDHSDPLDPNSSFVNTDLTDVVATQTENPNGTFVYVSGQEGLTVIRAFVTSSAPDTGVFTVIDLDGSTTAPDVRGPLPLSAVPGPIVATSASDGYVYTSDQGGGISVVSANPFVTINSVTPSGPYTASNPTFTISFNSDEICDGGSYQIRANGGITANGALLTSGTFTSSTVNPIITDPIDVTTASGLVEGTNEIFIFVENCASTEGVGFVNDMGRDMTTITVDLPPPNVTIQGVNFGNQRGYITIVRLTQNDINHYNIFVLEAADQLNPTCPGSLDFNTTSVHNSVGQAGSGGSMTLDVPGLTNGTFYCVAVQAVDNGGQTSPDRVAATTPILPELTVAITGKFGEQGCSMIPQETSRTGLGVFVLGIGLVGLVVFRVKSKWTSPPAPLLCKERGDLTPLLIKEGLGKVHSGKIFKFKKIVFLILLFLSSFFLSPKAQALEATPKRVSLGFEGGFFAPKNSVLKEFLSDCCNGFYNFYGGPIFDSKYEISLGVGFLIENGSAVGVTTDRISGDRFNFFVLPISTSFTFRGQFVEDQVVVPYATFGFDYMYFRENLTGSVTQGWKVGYHTGGGLMILLEWFESMSSFFEQDVGINDTFLTLGVKWMQVDNFGGGGLKFNGVIYSAGLLFEF